MPIHVLLECWHGPSHPEGRSHTSGSGACAGGCPGTAYLFFYDKQGCRGLKQDVAENLRTHVAEMFSEWIFWSAHFVVILLPLVEGWQRAMAVLDRWCQRSQVEHPDCPVPCMISSKSDSMPPLVGSALPSAAQMGQLEEGRQPCPQGAQFTAKREAP